MIAILAILISLISIAISLRTAWRIHMSNRRLEAMRVHSRAVADKLRESRRS